jgi:hypothetical protein
MKDQHLCGPELSCRFSSTVLLLIRVGWWLCIVKTMVRNLLVPIIRSICKQCGRLAMTRLSGLLFLS